MFQQKDQDRDNIIHLENELKNSHIEIENLKTKIEQLESEKGVSTMGVTLIRL